MTSISAHSYLVQGSSKLPKKIEPSENWPLKNGYCDPLSFSRLPPPPQITNTLSRFRRISKFSTRTFSQSLTTNQQYIKQVKPLISLDYSTVQVIHFIEELLTSCERNYHWKNVFVSFLTVIANRKLLLQAKADIYKWNKCVGTTSWSISSTSNKDIFSYDEWMMFPRNGNYELYLSI